MQKNLKNEQDKKVVKAAGTSLPETTGEAEKQPEYYNLPVSQMVDVFMLLMQVGIFPLDKSLHRKMCVSISPHYHGTCTA